MTIPNQMLLRFVYTFSISNWQWNDKFMEIGFEIPFWRDMTTFSSPISLQSADVHRQLSEHWTSRIKLYVISQLRIRQLSWSTLMTDCLMSNLSYFARDRWSLTRASERHNIFCSVFLVSLLDCGRKVLYSIVRLTWPVVAALPFYSSLLTIPLEYVSSPVKLNILMTCCSYLGFYFPGFWN